MTLDIRPLHPLFGAEIRGIDVSRALPDALFAQIRAAFEEHSLLLFRGQDLDDARQVAFSERFGPLETTVKSNPAGGTPFARQSNVDMATGAIIPPDDRRMIYQKGNYFWHSDSSFKRIPALCSLLSARIVPPEGGNTEFASMRAAYEALPEETRRKLDGLVALHSLDHSRSLAAPSVLTDEERSEVPPVPQIMVRRNPVNGRKSLFIGAHAYEIVGWPREEGRAFLAELTDFATQPRFCYSHEWRQGDLIVWDNRCMLHRATAYDATRHKRLMQRTTVAGNAPTVA